MDNIRVTLAVHWEGRHLDGVEHLARARARLLPGIPVTHFVSAAYFSRGGDIESIVDAMLPAFGPKDEVALHVPAWRSLRGAAQQPDHTVIVGEDPELSVEYPGITAQMDRGYTHPVSAYDKATIESLIVTSKLLLRPLLMRVVTERHLQLERVLRGIRAGHGMASDVFLEAACNTGFAYDASGIDAVWAERHCKLGEHTAARNADMFAPLWREWSRLWGPHEQSEPYLSNRGVRSATAGAGINASTQPFYVARCGSSRLLELPLNGGVMPPATPQHMAQRLADALDSPAGVTRIVGIAIRQETAEGCLDALLDSELLRSTRLRWTTNADLLQRLVGQPAVPEPEQHSPLQRIRQQLADNSPLSMPRPASMAPHPIPQNPMAPAVVVPPIQMPPIATGPMPSGRDT